MRPPRRIPLNGLVRHYTSTAATANGSTVTTTTKKEVKVVRLVAIPPKAQPGKPHSASPVKTVTVSSSPVVPSAAKSTHSTISSAPANVNVACGETMKVTLEANTMHIQRMVPTGDIPRLSHGLERVLFNPGVHYIRDLRTNVYNFDPHLQSLVSPEEFNFASLPPFIPASKDETLHRLAKDNDCSFVSSTSSISQTMSMIYFVLSKMRPLQLDNLTQSFAEEPKSFTLLTRSPAGVILKPHGKGIRSITVEKAEEPDNVLQKMGHVLERLLTEPKENFKRMLKGALNPWQVKELDGYAHTRAGKLLLRSQLDCHDPRLPRKTFDLKTRAALPVRMDVRNWERYGDYRLTQSTGLFQSFEREYYDMCRSAFLKYNFQVRIGDMDGIFVAYHNVQEIFGFQYLSKEEMDERIYGNTVTGDATFNLILQIYNRILETIAPLYPVENTLRFTFATDKTGSKLVVFSEDLGVGDGNRYITGLAPVGKDLRQFTFSMISTVDGYRSDDVRLTPDARLGGGPRERWQVNMLITQTKANLAEYDSIRSKAQGNPKDIENVVEGADARQSNMINVIKQNMAKSANWRPLPNGPEIIAPWTFGGSHY